MIFRDSYLNLLFTQMKGKFLSKENIHTAIWALIIASVSFIGGLVWKGFSGPDRVFIENRSTGKTDTLINILRIESDNPLLRPTPNNSSQIQVASSIPNKGKAHIAWPKFQFPEVVKGYKKRSIASFCSINISQQAYHTNEFIEIKLSMFDESIIKRSSPIFVEILERKTESSFTSIWKEQIKIYSSENVLFVPITFPKGEYKLSVGFYLIDEIHEEYPPRYMKEYKLKVV